MRASTNSLVLAVVVMVMLVSKPSLAGSSDGVLSSYSNPPFPPSNCQDQSGTTQYDQGYQAAWRIIVRNWGNSNGCSNYDSFIQIIQNAAPSSQGCYATGYRQAVDDATVQIRQSCAQDCTDIGDITGSSGAQIFCGMAASEMRRYTSGCTRIGLESCQNAFQSTVSSNCPDQLYTFQYQSQIASVCSPSGLGQ